jgi:hypothetical protein
MFPEHRDLISELKNNDMHFKKIFDEHNKLDEEIKENEVHYISEAEIKNMKKQKLKLKEELHKILLSHK